jgi:hypothetical protein
MYANPNQANLPIASTGNRKDENRRNILYKTLNIFKGGFYSQNEEVVMICGMLFIRIINEINSVGGDLVGDAWDWFVTTTVKPEFKRENKNEKMSPGGN